MTAAVYSHTSATQVESYQRCPRYWWNKHVRKLPEPFKPAAEKGGKVHKTTEGFLRTGKIETPDGEVIRIVQAHIVQLPLRGPELQIERKFQLPTFHGGPVWVGFVDLFDPRPTPVKVIDHKTTSDFRYCKTPEELLKNTQLMSYAYVNTHLELDALWTENGKLFVDGPDGKPTAEPSKRLPLPEWNTSEAVDVSLRYVRTKKPHHTNLVSAIATRKHIEEIWARDLETVGEMSKWYALAPKDVEDLSPNTASCGLYGGCTFLRECGFDRPPIQIRRTIPTTRRFEMSNEEKPALSMKERLEQKQAAKRAEAEAAKGTAAAPKAGSGPPPASVGVVPPDAPSRDEVPAAVPVAVAPEETKKASRKKSSAREEIVNAANEGGETPAAATPDLAPTLAPSGTTVPSGTMAPSGKRKKLTVYVGCMPTKAKDEPAHVLFEDFFPPFGVKIAAAHPTKPADWRMIKYGEHRGSLALLLAEAYNAGEIPEVLVMSDYTPGASDTLDVLTPFATRIVKSIR